MGRLARIMMLVVMLAISLAACAEEPPSTEADEQAIIQGVEQQLESFRDLASDEVAQAVIDSDENLVTLTSNGVDVKTLVGHLLAGFEYELGKVEVEGSNAQMAVTLSNKDLTAAITQAIESLNAGEDMDQIAQHYIDDDAQGLVNNVMDVIYRHINSMDERVTSNLVLYLHKDRNVWKLDYQSAQELVDAVLGNLDLTPTVQ